MKTKLTDNEKRKFYYDGFYVLRDIIPRDLILTAQSRYKTASPQDNLTYEKEFCDLVNRSPLTPIMRELMGDFDPVSATRHIVRVAGQKAGAGYAASGYLEKDEPYYGVNLHLDGQAVFPTPQEPQEGEPHEIYAKYISGGRKGNIGKSAENIGVNYSPLFHDPDMTNSMGSFTAFLFVCLSDQSMPGGGQTNVLKGAHHASEEFFRWQYQKDKRLGIDGPGWPRLDHEVPNRCGYRFLPDMILNQFVDDTSATTPDGRRWPRPTPVYMKPGDATIAMYHIPHSGARNENGRSARKSPIFALVNKKRHPNHRVDGHSDHPDRHWDGGFYDFPDGKAQYERSKFAMLNMYHEWEGMKEIVAQERANAGKSNEIFNL